MDSQEEIEKDIICNFPLVFDQSGLFTKEQEKENNEILFRFAIEATTPFLRTETIRYQYLLLYSSLSLITISYFEVDSTTLGVTVDQKLLNIYSIFIFILTLIFLMKAWLDNQRVQYIRAKASLNNEKIVETTMVPLYKQAVQVHFLTKISREIRGTKHHHLKTLRKYLNLPPLDFLEERCNVFYGINIDGYDRLGNELAEEIKSKKKFFEEICQKLKSDTVKLNTEIEHLWKTKQDNIKKMEGISRSNFEQSPDFDGSLTNEFNKTYDKYFGNWTKAIDNLIDKEFEEISSPPCKRATNVPRIVDKKT